MKKKILAIGFPIFVVSLALSMSFISNSSKEADASVGHYSNDAATYYNGVTATSGKQLAAQLHDLITSTHKTYTTYADNGKNLYQQNTNYMMEL